MSIRSIVKPVATAVLCAIAFVLLIPLFVLYFVRIFSFITCAFMVSLVPGTFGIMVRRTWYKLTLQSCGRELTLDFMAAIRTPKAVVGNNVYIGVNSFMGNVEIGDDTMISGNVMVLSGARQHGYKQFDVPMRLQEGTVARIKIGEDCWIGARATIMADVAPHSIVGTCSLVKETFKPYDIIAGNPAQKLKSRKDAKTPNP